MEEVGVIGVGKLGLCMALILENVGYSVKCYDKNEGLAEAISTKSLDSIEPRVSEMLKRSTNISVFKSLSDIYRLKSIFIVVATPSLSNGSYNHSAVEEVIDTILELNSQTPDYNEKLLVVSCTTMPGYCDTVQERLNKYNYRVCYNPEFIAQGNIVDGLVKPDMVLIGHTSSTASESLSKIYNAFLKNSPPVKMMSRTEAEITKIALNCFLTTKIAFANMIGDIVVKAGGNPSIVLNAIGSDTRVGNKFLKWGHGFGGPCLPRDNRALSYFSKTIHIDHEIGETTDQSNKKHLKYLLDYIVSLNKDNRPILFNSVVYKEGTNILEESQKLELALLCRNTGLDVSIYDNPIIINQLKSIYGGTFKYLDQLTDEQIKGYFNVDAYIN